MEEDLLRISDGKLYDLNDMVKVGCHDCAGCSDCCKGMGESILLDPYDVFRLTGNLSMSFEQLLAGPVELHVEEGLILPNLKMQGETETCPFLDENGRCGIHAFRPGLCRLFPLGRNYEGNRLQYFLLVNECPVKNKTKMKVSKWIDEQRIRDYQEFLIEWHNLSKQVRAHIAECIEDEGKARTLTMQFLQQFYILPYEDDFYAEIKNRIAGWRQ